MAVRKTELLVISGCALLLACIAFTNGAAGSMHYSLTSTRLAAPAVSNTFTSGPTSMATPLYSTVSDNAETRTQNEAPSGSLTGINASWVPYSLASALFGAVAALLAVFRPKAPQPQPVEVDLETAPLQGTRRQALAGGLAGVAAATALSVDPQQPASAAGLFGGQNEILDWEQVEIPGISGQDFTFYDVTMLDDKRGFLVGSREVFLETIDGGKTWNQRIINTQDDLPYRFTSISFSGDEGWLVGKPAILMHTTNGGKDWERIGLSPNLPGTPISITATGNGGAEMCTDQGGLYITNNTAQTWRAQVEETVDATLNRTVSSGISGASYYTGSFGTVARSEDGRYIGVSSRGNFYMTWEPGQTYWMPHNRSGARRIQTMGWRPDGGIWEIGRGGQLSFGKGVGIQDEFDQLKINSRGYGLLDVAWHSDEEVWTVGGSGTLIKSTDGGQKWQRQRGLDEIAANLYEVRFFNGGKTGFVLGNSGVLLRYIPK